METTVKYTPLWRSIALASLLANLVFNALINKISPSGKSMEQITEQYGSQFTPANYAFSIWGFIYLAQLVYAVVQVLPSQQHNYAYDKLARPFSAANILSVLWLISFTSERIGLSVFFIMAMLANAIYMFVVVKREENVVHVSPWTEVPFSAYAGWLSVATIANISLYLIAFGWEASGAAASQWTAALIVTATMLGIIIGLRMKDFIFPLAIAWGIMAIWVEHQSDNQTVALTALVGGLALATVAIFQAFRNYFKFGNTNTLSPPVA